MPSLPRQLVFDLFAFAAEVCIKIGCLGSRSCRFARPAPPRDGRPKAGDLAKKLALVLLGAGKLSGVRAAGLGACEEAGGGGGGVGALEQSKRRAEGERGRAGGDASDTGGKRGRYLKGLYRAQM